MLTLTPMKYWGARNKGALAIAMQIIDLINQIQIRTDHSEYRYDDFCVSGTNIPDPVYIDLTENIAEGYKNLSLIDQKFVDRILLGESLRVGWADIKIIWRLNSPKEIRFLSNPKTVRHYPD
jgi:hypothetical protein